MSTSSALYEEGMSVLTKNLGADRAKQFVSQLVSEASDYTKWHQRFADEMTPEKFHSLLEEYKRNPYMGDPSTII